MKPRNILIGVSGGVAAYKALDLVSALRKQGHTMRVVMTKSACEFVKPSSFTAVSGAPAMTSMWTKTPTTLVEEYPHLYPATQTDIFVLAPATANTIAKIANGFGSDLLSTSCLSLPPECHKFFCPAMNVEMWHNRMVQENVRKLEADGWQRLGPASGHLACGMEGEGRLMESKDILEAMDPLLKNARPLEGKKLLMLSGPTREHMDPIRFIGNPSSGLMGRALADEAVRQGASVHFVTGPVPEDHLPIHPGITLDRVTGAQEMLEHARAHLQDMDGVLYVAAVADYRPENPETEKRPKSKEGFELKLVPNPDLAATLNAEKRPETKSIGFALQTDSGEQAAADKLERKGLDGIVLNYPDTMGSTTGHFRFLAKGADSFLEWGALNKPEAARRILQQIH